MNSNKSRTPMLNSKNTIKLIYSLIRRYEEGKVRPVSNDLSSLSLGQAITLT